MTAARNDASDISYGAEQVGSTETVQPTDTLATVTDVTGRIAARQIIDEAKRLLMTDRGMTEPQAHRWIQKTSMDRRSPKVQVATGIVSALRQVGEKPTGTG